jgi:hypothetical protein
MHSTPTTSSSRCNDSEEFLRITINVTVDKDFPFPIKKADIHFPVVEINSAVVFVGFCVKFHGKASFGEWVLAKSSIP